MVVVGKSLTVYRDSSSGSKVVVSIEHKCRQTALVVERIQQTLSSTKDRFDELSFDAAYEVPLKNLEVTKKKAAKVTEAYACLGVLCLYTEQNHLSYVVLVTERQSVGQLLGNEIFKVTSVVTVPLQDTGGSSGNSTDNRPAALQRLLCNGCFHYSTNSEGTGLDLSANLQLRNRGIYFDDRFIWNLSLLQNVVCFGVELQAWLVSIICGSVEVKTQYSGSSQVKCSVVSRLSRERAGTRFSTRGVNDDGRVASFAETEQIVEREDVVTSFVQIRGSVPIFWEQPGIQFGAHKVELTRTSGPAFDRHMSYLTSWYGKILIVNLLGRAEGEAALTKAYFNCYTNSDFFQSTDFVHFDFHEICRGGHTKHLDVLVSRVNPFLDNMKFFFSASGTVVGEQLGVIRTNCLDCLDRTNIVQMTFALEVLQHQLMPVLENNTPAVVNRFKETFRQLWHQSGNSISLMLSGTGALDSTIKGTLASRLKDGATSVRRTIQNNFLDFPKQESIEALLQWCKASLFEEGRTILPAYLLTVPRSLLRTVVMSKHDFLKTRQLRIAVATWNVNGGRQLMGKDWDPDSIRQWLFDHHLRSPHCVMDGGAKDLATLRPDVYAVGLQEIVDLTASNIISTSSEQKNRWGTILLTELNKDSHYTLITCEQLVGICLFLFAKTEFAPYIRNVSVSSLKTGLKGKTGNKGAVGISLGLLSTPLCFVCSHFTAGQMNVTDRNADFATIAENMTFSGGRGVFMHDFVFWCGDFNYRIGMDNSLVQRLVERRCWAELLVCDQLTQSMQNGQVFKDFVEGRINFAPTYKYDIGSDVYDTSEKRRIPAWTDRALWWCSPQLRANSASSRCRQLFYGRAELKSSDHRPVVAVFDVDALQVDYPSLCSVWNEAVLLVGSVEIQVANPRIGMANLLQLILSTFSEFGLIAFTKWTESAIRITYQNSQSSIQALTMDGTKLLDHVLSVKLKSELEGIISVHPRAFQPTFECTLSGQWLSTIDYTLLDGDIIPWEARAIRTKDLHTLEQQQSHLGPPARPAKPPHSSSMLDLLPDLESPPDLPHASSMPFIQYSVDQQPTSSTSRSSCLLDDILFGREHSSDTPLKFDIGDPALVGHESNASSSSVHFEDPWNTGISMRAPDYHPPQLLDTSFAESAWWQHQDPSSSTGGTPAVSPPVQPTFSYEESLADTFRHSLNVSTAAAPSADQRSQTLGGNWLGVVSGPPLPSSREQRNSMPRAGSAGHSDKVWSFDTPQAVDSLKTKEDQTFIKRPPRNLPPRGNGPPPLPPR